MTRPPDKSTEREELEYRVGVVVLMILAVVLVSVLWALVIHPHL